MPRSRPRTKSRRAERAALPALLSILVLLAVPAPAARGAVERKAKVLVEYGIDAYQRKYYRPSFNFVADAPLLERTQLFLNMAYLQRANGRLEGPIDFWLDGGLEHRLAEGVTAGLDLTHFCRHVISVSNPYILNYNEAVARVRMTEGPIRLGLGFGGYAGGTPGLSRLLVFDLAVARLGLPELSFEGSVKWADFDSLYYEAGLAFALGRGIDLVFRKSRTYGIPPETFIGLRLASDGAVQESVDRFDMTFGLTPFHDDYKIVAGGGYRLVFLRAEDRRLLVDVEFDTPLLNGRSFFAQFWPDRMIYRIGAQYEIAGQGFTAAWYARYTADMPSDRPSPFASRLATGIALRNQRDFDALDHPFRVEAFVGYDFRRALDLGARAGVNTVGMRPFDIGLEAEGHLADGRLAYEIKAFAAAGKEISVRPFLGIRRIGLFAMEPAAAEPLKQDITWGVSFIKWY
jgi:hypothetical protein